MSSRGSNPITGRYAPSEEYRRKLRHRHVLESICLIIAVMMIVLCSIFMLEIDRSMMTLRVIILMGVLLNLILAIRLFMVKYWLAGIGLLLLCALCAGGFAYLALT